MKQLDPKAYWLFVVGSVLSSIFSISVFTLVVYFNVLEDNRKVDGMPFVLVALGLIVLAIPVSLVWNKFAYNAYKYELTEDAFKKEQGVISKKYVSIPYERIQNVDIYRGPIARILGLSDLQIQTAGGSFNPRKRNRGSDAEGRLPGLAAADAAAMRDELIKRAKAASQATA
jgi:uncharacterized membrane protein YdbT with pleckstrin-like domain